MTRTWKEKFLDWQNQNQTVRVSFGIGGCKEIVVGTIEEVGEDFVEIHDQGIGYSGCIGYSCIITAQLLGDSSRWG